MQHQLNRTLQNRCHNQTVGWHFLTKESTANGQRTFWNKQEDSHQHLWLLNNRTCTTKETWSCNQPYCRSDAWVDLYHDEPEGSPPYPVPQPECEGESQTSADSSSSESWRTSQTPEVDCWRTASQRGIPGQAEMQPLQIWETSVPEQRVFCIGTCTKWP